MTLQATAIRRPGSDSPLDEAQLAVVAFLARYGGRTLEAYRHDLRTYFPVGTRQPAHGARRHSASR